MTRTIKIVSAEDAASPSGCGSRDKDNTPQREKFAAGIDTDIFEADTQELGGERFWESFWKTQHVYGGVHEGQSLAGIFGALGDDVFEKLRTDVERLHTNDAAMSDADKDDVFGMVMFLLGMERGDVQYNPLEQEGYAGALGRFAAAVAAEARRRAAA